MIKFKDPLKNKHYDNYNENKNKTSNNLNINNTNNIANNNSNKKDDDKKVVSNDLRERVLSEIVDSKPGVTFSDVYPHLSKMYSHTDFGNSILTFITHFQ